MKTPIRMKNKTMTKMHLNSSGQMAQTPIKAASDLVSKGIQAQPANPLTEAENAGLPGTPPSQTASTVTEETTGAPMERVAPEQLPEADKQPEMKDLEQAPSQDAPKVLKAEQK